MEVDVTTLSILVGTVLPIVVGVVTKQLADSRLKSTLLLLLSGIAGVVQQAVVNEGVFTKETIVAAGITWVTAVATYYGFLKPAGVSPAINEATSDFGLGSNTTRS